MNQIYNIGIKKQTSGCFGLFFCSLLLYCFLFLNPANAQQINYLGVDDGLSGRYTFNTVQDKKGFIWISTRFGVDRFDGCNVRNYPVNILHESQSPIRTMQVILDEDSALWAFTNRGAIYTYHTEKDEFILSNYLDQYIRTACFDSNNNLWFCDRRELSVLKDNQVTTVLSFPYKKEEIKIIKKYDEENLFIVTTENIYRFHISTGQLTSLINNIKFRGIESGYFDSEMKTIWIGSIDKGLYIYDMQTKILKHIYDKRLLFHPILCIEKTDENHLFAGTDGAGLCLLNTNTLKIEKIYSNQNHEATRINGNAIYDIYKDREGRIWLSTFSDGINILNMSNTDFHIIRHEENNDNSLCCNVVCDILEDHEKNLWFATNNGLSLWNTKKNQWTTYLQNKNVLNLFLDSRGDIWAGTYSSGVYVFDRHGNLKNNIVVDSSNSQNSPGTNFVYSISEDDSGNIWFGGRKGNLTKFNINSGSFEQLPVTLVNFIMPKSKSEMLVATELGVFSVPNNAKKGKSCSFNKKLKSLFVTDMYMESDSILWISTYGSGINRCNYYTGEVESFSITEGLPSDIIYSLLPDDDGNLWFSSELGIGFFNTQKHKVFSFSKMDGISGNQFRSLSRLKDSNGIFYFGSYEGVTYFNPENLQKRRSSGHLFFQNFFLFNKIVKPGDNDSPLQYALDNTSEIKLRYNQHSFSINFSAIDYTSNQNRRFIWMLDGIDRDYNSPTSETTANYTNIDAGEYTFRLRYLGDNNSIIDERVLKIIVAPPFWNTTWARIIEFLLLIAIALGIYLQIKRRIRKKQTQERINFFLRMARDIRNPLMLIKAPVYELRAMSETNQRSEYLFDTIARNLEKLIGLFAHLLDYRRELEEIKEQEAIEIPEITSDFEQDKDQYKILLVEGDEELRNFLVVSMKNDMEIIVSEQPDDAWNKIQETNPDIVITDLFLPELSGFILLEKIKNTFESSHIPVIMLSATTDKQLKLKALHDGVDNYIEKPFEINELKLRIENILNNRKLLRRKFIGVNDMNEIPANELDAKFIQQATMIVEQNLTNTRFSISDFSKEMGVSRSLLYTKFNTLTGYTPNDYIKVVRMKKAIEYFQENKFTINEVSSMVGIEEPAYFSTCFKKIYGMSPKNFIKTNINPKFNK